jgi:hypothetical protein
LANWSCFGVELGSWAEARTIFRASTKLRVLILGGLLVISHKDWENREPQIAVFRHSVWSLVERCSSTLFLRVLMALPQDPGLDLSPALSWTDGCLCPLRGIQKDSSLIADGLLVSRHESREIELSKITAMLHSSQQRQSSVVASSKPGHPMSSKPRQVSVIPAAGAHFQHVIEIGGLSEHHPFVSV